MSGVTGRLPPEPSSIRSTTPAGAEVSKATTPPKEMSTLVKTAKEQIKVVSDVLSRAEFAETMGVLQGKHTMKVTVSTRSGLLGDLNTSITKLETILTELPATSSQKTKINAKLAELKRAVEDIRTGVGQPKREGLENFPHPKELLGTKYKGVVKDIQLALDVALKEEKAKASTSPTPSRPPSVAGNEIPPPPEEEEPPLPPPEEEISDIVPLPDYDALLDEEIAEHSLPPPPLSPTERGLPPKVPLFERPSSGTKTTPPPLARSDTASSGSASHLKPVRSLTEEDKAKAEKESLKRSTEELQKHIDLGMRFSRIKSLQETIIPDLEGQIKGIKTSLFQKDPLKDSLSAQLAIFKKELESLKPEPLDPKKKESAIKNLREKDKALSAQLTTLSDYQAIADESWKLKKDSFRSGEEGQKFIDSHVKRKMKFLEQSTIITQQRLAIGEEIKYLNGESSRPLIQIDLGITIERAKSDLINKLQNELLDQARLSGASERDAIIKQSAELKPDIPFIKLRIARYLENYETKIRNALMITDIVSDPKKDPIVEAKEKAEKMDKTVKKLVENERVLLKDLLIGAFDPTLEQQKKLVLGFKISAGGEVIKKTVDDYIARFKAKQERILSLTTDHTPEALQKLLGEDVLRAREQIYSSLIEDLESQLETGRPAVSDFTGEKPEITKHLTKIDRGLAEIQKATGLPSGKLAIDSALKAARLKESLTIGRAPLQEAGNKLVAETPKAEWAKAIGEHLETIKPKVAKLVRLTGAAVEQAAIDKVVTEEITAEKSRLTQLHNKKFSSPPPRRA